MSSSELILSQSELSFLYIFYISLSFIGALLSSILIVISISHRQKLKRIVNCEFASIMVGSFLIKCIQSFFIIVNNPLYDSLLSKILNSFYNTIQIVAFGIITLILTYSYLVLEHTEFIKVYYNIFIFHIGLWIYCIVITVVLVLFGNLTLSNTKDYIDNNSFISIANLLIFGLLLALQIFCLYKIYKQYKELSKEDKEEREGQDKKRIISLGLAEIILMITASVSLSTFYYTSMKIILYLSKILQALSPLVYLFIYGYDTEELMVVKNKILCCDSNKQKEEKNKDPELSLITKDLKSSD